MTVSSTNTKRQFNGDGSTAAFAYNFKVFADADLQVIVRSATGTESVKTSELVKQAVVRLHLHPATSQPAAKQ